MAIGVFHRHGDIGRSRSSFRSLQHQHGVFDVIKDIDGLHGDGDGWAVAAVDGSIADRLAIAFAFHQLTEDRMVEVQVSRGAFGDDESDATFCAATDRPPWHRRR